MLPIFLSLHTFTALIESRADFTLVDAVCEHMQRRWRQMAPRAWVKYSDNCFLAGLPSGCGCWICLESGTVWKGSNLPSFDMMSNKIQAFITGDWSRQSVNFADLAHPLRLAHQLARFLACDLERDLAPDLAFAFERLQVCDLEQSFALTHR